MENQKREELYSLEFDKESKKALSKIYTAIQDYVSKFHIDILRVDYNKPEEKDLEIFINYSKKRPFS